MAEILIAARDFNTFKKGWPVVVKDSPAVWGAKEALPDFVILRVPDATKEQIINYVKQWPIKFSHSILAENDQGYRINVEVDEQYVDISQRAKNKIKSVMCSWLIADAQASIINWDSSQVTFDIAKPVDLQALKLDFADKFDDIFEQRRYRFSDADVDLAIAQGGSVTLSRNQVLNRIIDRVTE